MAWLVFFVTVALAAVLGIVVNLNRIGFERRLAGEMRGLLAVPPSAAPRPDVADPVAHLPPPVARYRQLAVAERAPVRTLRLHPRGTFRISLTAKALPIQGTQLFTADPPGFVWTGRIRMFRGAWIDARDMIVSVLCRADQTSGIAREELTRSIWSVGSFEMIEWSAGDKFFKRNR